MIYILINKQKASIKFIFMYKFTLLNNKTSIDEDYNVEINRDIKLKYKIILLFNSNYLKSDRYND